MSSAAKSMALIHDPMRGAGVQGREISTYSGWVGEGCGGRGDAPPMAVLRLTLIEMVSCRREVRRQLGMGMGTRGRERWGSKRRGRTIESN